jgi:hypothetical protein
MPARLDIRKNFFSHRVAKKWNSVPHEIKRAKNVDMFKIQYKKMLRNGPGGMLDADSTDNIR